MGMTRTWYVSYIDKIEFGDEALELVPNVMITYPFPVDQAFDLWLWTNTPRSANYDDFGPESFYEFQEELKRRIISEITWAIRVNGEVVGYAGVAAINPIMFQFRGLTISPKMRSKGVGSAAIYLIRDHLKELGMKKLITYFYADNEAILNTFRSVGGVEEGYIKGASLRDGKPLDLRLWEL